MEDLNILIAFSAGILSFFSPCVLPLIPVYLASMGARAFQGEGSSKDLPSRGRALLVSLSFVLGFTLVFVIMGASIGFLGRAFLEYRQVLYRIGGLLVILLGLKQLGLLKVSFLEGSWKISGSTGRTSGLIGAFALGAIFSIGWSPCVGPVLAGILLLSLVAPSPFTAAGYLFIY
ncbi:MAG: cytochrome c biogenesis protein CcdA, partial [Candidatus Contubernalis sp.]|nr:cytochrome c biogenesis protein CcdA [Candidatus Contubernalis sp.]